MPKNLTPEQQRKAQIKGLESEIETLKREARQRAKIEAEKHELKRLQRELHPSKFRRLARIIGKAEHGGVAVGKAFLTAGKEVHKAQKKYEKMRGR